MNIKNNTNKKLVIYLGYEGDEEPKMVKTLLIGENMGVNAEVIELVSIQEN